MRDYYQSHTCPTVKGTFTMVSTYPLCKRPPKRQRCPVCKKRFDMHSQPTQKIYFSRISNPERWE